MFLAASIVPAGGWIAEAVGRSSNGSGGFGMLGWFAARVMGGLGLAVLLSDYAGKRRE